MLYVVKIACNTLISWLWHRLVTLYCLLHSCSCWMRFVVVLRVSFTIAFGNINITHECHLKEAIATKVQKTVKYVSLSANVSEVAQRTLTHFDNIESTYSMLTNLTQLALKACGNFLYFPGVGCIKGV
mgnify:CR=1 FL=1